MLFHQLPHSDLKPMSQKDLDMSFQRKRINIGNYDTYRTPQRKSFSDLPLCVVDRTDKLGVFSPTPRISRLLVRQQIRWVRGNREIRKFERREAIKERYFSPPTRDKSRVPGTTYTGPHHSAHKVVALGESSSGDHNSQSERGQSKSKTNNKKG